MCYGFKEPSSVLLRESVVEINSLKVKIAKYDVKLASLISSQHSSYQFSGSTHKRKIFGVLFSQRQQHSNSENFDAIHTTVT
jgi:hypothetical protein